MPHTILLLHHGRDWIRGSERCLLDLAAHLDTRRFRAVIMCDAPAVADAARALGIAVVQTTGWDEEGSSLAPRRKRIAELKAVIEKFDVRLIHANNLLPVKPAIVVARRRGIPIVAQLHLQTNLDERLYTGLHQADAIVGVSEAVIADLRRDGLHDARIRVIHNGVDPHRLDSGDASTFRREHGIPSAAFLFVAVTSLIPLKAVDVILRAAARADGTKRPAHLAIIGSGPSERELRALADELGIPERVHFCGVRDDVGAILRQAAEAVVTASRVEAFPLNVLEAGYCGRPVIASDIAPHLEAIIPDQTGLVVQTDDVVGFARAMSQLATDRDAATKMGQNAQAHVRGRYLLRDNVRHFQDLYDELLARPAWTFRWPFRVALPSAYGRWAYRLIRRRLARLLRRGHGVRRAPN